MPLLSIDQMKGLHKLVFAFSILLMVASCGKKNSTPTRHFFTYKVAISNKIKEPTIVNGYYGHMNLYEGDFSTQDSTKTPEAVDKCILLFETKNKDFIESTSYMKDGVKFYNLKKLKKEGIEAKFEIIPNKHGFYQVDNNSTSYLALIRLNKKTGYYKGGLHTLDILNNELKSLEFRIDYKAKF